MKDYEKYTAAQPIAQFVAEHDPDALEKASEALFERVVADFGDVKASDDTRTLGVIARGELFARRNLKVGQDRAEIEGMDHEGKGFTLRDYRGKVVVLSFSGNWCGPCRGMYPQDRALVANLKDKPFALVSVNTDKDSATLQQSISLRRDHLALLVRRRHRWPDHDPVGRGLVSLDLCARRRRSDSVPERRAAMIWTMRLRRCWLRSSRQRIDGNPLDLGKTVSDSTVMNPDGEPAACRKLRLSDAMILVAGLVAAAWVVLALIRRWRTEARWVDRMGKLLGVMAIGLRSWDSSCTGSEEAGPSQQWCRAKSRGRIPKSPARCHNRNARWTSCWSEVYRRHSALELAGRGTQRDSARRWARWGTDMGEEHSDKFGAVHIELARRIDAVCRRFQADRRAGKTSPIEGYLDDICEEGRAALRAEIEALERRAAPGR